jgi:hypothetical protein
MLIRVIETDTLETGDFVAFKSERVNGEWAGTFEKYNTKGEIDVKVLTSKGAEIVSVAHEDVTDILAA